LIFPPLTQAVSGLRGRLSETGSRNKWLLVAFNRAQLEQVINMFNCYNICRCIPMGLFQISVECPTSNIQLAWRTYWTDLNKSTGALIGHARSSARQLHHDLLRTDWLQTLPQSRWRPLSSERVYSNATVHTGVQFSSVRVTWTML